MPSLREDRNADHANNVSSEHQFDQLEACLGEIGKEKIEAIGCLTKQDIAQAVRLAISSGELDSLDLTEDAGQVVAQNIIEHIKTVMTLATS